MLDAVLISNGLVGLDRWFRSDERVRYRTVETGPGFAAALARALAGADLLVVPNGSDHVAMWQGREAVAGFLAQGRALVCGDGWFTGWVPGNRWVMDNSRATRDVRYRVRSDRRGLLAGVDLEEINFSHGMSGWWACGYIEPAAGAEVVLEDTWGRAVMVLDEATTRGRMLLTASGPLPGFPREDGREDALTRLYRNVLAMLTEVAGVAADAREESRCPASAASA